MTPNEFIEANGLTMTAKFVPQSQSRNAAEKHRSLNWRVTVKGSRHEIETDYMQGIGHAQIDYQNKHLRARGGLCIADDAQERRAAEDGLDRRGQIPPPELADVLHCLVMDAEAIDYADFADWADCYGYDSDSIKARDTYTACVNTALKLCQMIDLDEAREAFEDY